jgi:hypothetical protein
MNTGIGDTINLAWNSQSRTPARRILCAARHQ